MYFNLNSLEILIDGVILSEMALFQTPTKISTIINGMKLKGKCWVLCLGGRQMAGK